LRTATVALMFVSKCFWGRRLWDPSELGYILPLNIIL